mmetsp:Transcript_20794/g.42276  ORF Transcript_20794/g.42276 Transcript_20794/m.42276 type:complete len:144 (+) Transcript_20794:62-493(+)|eukprot:CAMPEP_0181288478 /NCGR_PEP_ID=MMETSP1101-20121128/353_1 /TAXON_ID=46948 /ORGANISM="Rhodomonas abbreviata, Strain Caron Lab Isolate" /LENGTH=143 /DNA_ID=CAMNT_0023392601 /DNA_START=62 /DNA_END=493 /DNA_ORIENTATION=+
MSDALVWHLIRDNNSFMVKRGRTSRCGNVQFSSEAGNLLNAHCFKYSGVANSKSVGLSSTLALTTSNPKAQNKPSKATTTAQLNHRVGVKKLTATVVAACASRPDLLAAAKVRVAKACAGAIRANLTHVKKSKKAVRASRRSK